MKDVIAVLPKSANLSARSATVSRYVLQRKRATGIPFRKAYTVVNVAQVDSLPAHYYAQPEENAERLRLIERADEFFAATPAPVIANALRLRRVAL